MWELFSLELNFLQSVLFLFFNKPNAMFFYKTVQFPALWSHDQHVQLYRLCVHDTIYWLTFYDWVCVCLFMQKFKQITFAVLSCMCTLTYLFPMQLPLWQLPAHTHIRAYPQWTLILTAITKLYQKFSFHGYYTRPFTAWLYSTLLTLFFSLLLACSSWVV